MELFFSHFSRRWVVFFAVGTALFAVPWLICIALLALYSPPAPILDGPMPFDTTLTVSGMLGLPVLWFSSVLFPTGLHYYS